MKHYDNDFMNRMIDGDTSIEEKKEFLDHKAVCPECAREYEYLQKADTAFRQLRVFTAPATINAMVLKKIVKTVKPGEGSKKFFIGMLVGLTSILLLIFGFALRAGGESASAATGEKFSLKIDPTFFTEIAKPFSGLKSFLNPEFGGVLLLLVLSIATFFFIEKLKKN